MLEKVKSFIQNEILSTLKGDIIGGISVAFVALPLALSLVCCPAQVLLPGYMVQSAPVFWLPCLAAQKRRSPGQQEP